MPKANEIAQQPTKWKEFKTEHPKTAKIIQVTKGAGYGAAIAAAVAAPGVVVAAIAAAPVTALGIAVGAVVVGSMVVLSGALAAEEEAKRIDLKNIRSAPTKDSLSSEPTHVSLPEITKPVAPAKSTEQPRWGQGDFVRTNTSPQIELKEKIEAEYWIKENEENSKKIEQNKSHNSYKYDFGM